MRGFDYVENMIFCQSCGMPMQELAHFGTEKDGAQNNEYCVYCYKDGAFTADITMDEMIAYCAEHIGEWDMDITKEQAIAQMKEHFPTLKRWAQA